MSKGTPLGRVRGLGSAHEGAHHWLLQRFTAIGNLVLMIWLAVSLLLLPDLTYATLSDWLSGALPAMAMSLLIVSLFWHARLGLQVLIEDYVHEGGARFATMALLNLATIACAVFGLFCVVRLALAGGAA